ncbi:unnamed protein product [Ranitomeya imitator]|uniref:Uncharacterized protein n=1 Tax=Ranitomeya imitator TaxID=111125 RepID=A0ABN9MFS8_9NEOB|nr:unnamed protein product [Ranitomeya imitator]
MVVDDEEKANILNTFSTVFTVENEMLGEIPRNNENPILRVTNLTQEEVRNRLNKIKIDKSPGPDGIHPRVLRELTTGSVPQDWRIANVVPIFKKGSKSEPGNYRPHDVSQVLLKGTLDSVVEECVSFVGVDINICSEILLRHIAGLNSVRAKNVIEWREKNGPFITREQLKCVKGLGPKSFQQCAGFIRVNQEYVRNLLR